MNPSLSDEAAPAIPARSAEGPAPAPAEVAGFDWRRVGPYDAAGLVAVSAGLLWAYWPNFASLYATWVREPDYSHGFLVLPIALVILWKLWPTPEAARPSTGAPGWALALAALGARWYFHEVGATWSETATVIPLVVGLAVARMGWRTFARVWPAFAFLIFLLPLPDAVNASVSQPLQSLATKFSCALLKLSGLWVMPEGNVILVGNERLEVAAACNGLSMLMSLSATVAATATLLPMATSKRVVLLLSIVPIALFSNVLRIAATAWCYYKFGADVGSRYAHDGAGYLMMPLAMVLVGLELALLSWLVTESTVATRPDGLLNLDRVQNSWNAGARS